MAEYNILDKDYDAEWDYNYDFNGINNLEIAEIGRLSNPPYRLIVCARKKNEAAHIVIQDFSTCQTLAKILLEDKILDKSGDTVNKISSITVLEDECGIVNPKLENALIKWFNAKNKRFSMLTNYAGARTAWDMQHEVLSYHEATKPSKKLKPPGNLTLQEQRLWIREQCRERYVDNCVKSICQKHKKLGKGALFNSANNISLYAMRNKGVQSPRLANIIGRVATEVIDELCKDPTGFKIYEIADACKGIIRSLRKDKITWKKK
jgi:hypothetical protein